MAMRGNSIPHPEQKSTKTIFLYGVESKVIYVFEQFYQRYLLTYHSVYWRDFIHFLRLVFTNLDIIILQDLLTIGMSHVKDGKLLFVKSIVG